MDLFGNDGMYFGAIILFILAIILIADYFLGINHLTDMRDKFRRWRFSVDCKKSLKILDEHRCYLEEKNAHIILKSQCAYNAQNRQMSMHSNQGRLAYCRKNPETGDTTIV